jgi:hypothetical protein
MWAHLGNGCFPIADELCAQPEGFGTPLEVHQVKGKIGVLCFQVGMDDGSPSPERAETFTKQRKLVGAASGVSKTVCENCGFPSTLHGEDTGRWTTLCPTYTRAFQEAADELGV